MILRILKKLSKTLPPRSEFLGTSIDSISGEKVTLIQNDNRMDVSDSFCPLCIDPFVIGIWSNGFGKFNDNEDMELLFETRKKSAAIVKIGKLKKYELGTETVLWLVQAVETKLIDVSWFKRIYLIRLLKIRNQDSKFDLSSSILLHLAAIYAYPRKVLITTSMDIDNGYLNIFPMDLHGRLQAAGYYVFGLQPANRACSVIKKTGMVVVSEVPSSFGKEIYSLGQNHGYTNLFGQEQEIDLKQSPVFKFPIPEVAFKVYEIRIVEQCLLGTHHFFLGKCTTTILNKQHEQLYHVHWLFK